MTTAAGDDEDEWGLPPEVSVRAPARPDARARAMGLAYGVEPPMTEAEYERALEVMRAPHAPNYVPRNPHRCCFNEAPRHSGVLFQCTTVVPDPRRIRYCLKHAAKVGYPMTPEDVEELSRLEARTALHGLTTTAVATLRTVMDDPDAPAGARAKAATDILDRTGFHAKAELDVKAEAVVVDLAAIIRDRLASKREALLSAQGAIEGQVVDSDGGVV